MISASPSTAHPTEPTQDPPPPTGTHSEESGHTLVAEAWMRFRASKLAMTGLIVVFLLFCVAILSPFIANNKPFYLVAITKTVKTATVAAPQAGGATAEVQRTTTLQRETSYPIFHSLTKEDLRWLMYPVLAVVIWCVRRRFYGMTLAAIALIGFGVVELTVADHRNIVDMKDYRTMVAQAKWMPPIPFNPLEQECEILLPPSTTNLMGTDKIGRDIASRLIHASRISLTVGFVATSISISLGLLVGALAGFYRGWVDIALSRFIEIMECFPTMFLILAVLAFLQPSLYNIMLVIGFTSWTGTARLVRGEFLRLSEQQFAMAASALGASDARIIILHILPNAMGPVLISATFGVASAILVESGLSFLGMGVQPPTPTWGDMLSQARDSVVSTWWLAVFPGIMIFITITSYNLVGQGIRDATDPRLRD